MSALLHRCTKCREYSLRDVCSHCGEKAVVNQPPKYSPEDPYGKYRRQLKKLDKES